MVVNLTRLLSNYLAGVVFINSVFHREKWDFVFHQHLFCTSLNSQHTIIDHTPHTFNRQEITDTLNKCLTHKKYT